MPFGTEAAMERDKNQLISVPVKEQPQLPYLAAINPTGQKTLMEKLGILSDAATMFPALPAVWGERGTGQGSAIRLPEGSATALELTGDAFRF